MISRKVKMQLKHTEKICAVCREGAVTDQMCQKWFVKFHAGDFSLDDAPGSGRPVEVDSSQIETLIGNNQHCTTQETADTLKTSKSMKLLVNMKNVSFILWKKLNVLFGQPNSSTYIISNNKILSLAQMTFLVLFVLAIYATRAYT